MPTLPVPIGRRLPAVLAGLSSHPRPGQALQRATVLVAGAAYPVGQAVAAGTIATGLGPGW